MKLLLLLLLLFLYICNINGSYLPVVPKVGKYKKVRVAYDNEPITLIIAVKHKVNARQFLEDACNRVSYPSSVNYGQYLKMEDVRDQIVSKENLNHIINFIKNKGGVYSILDSYDAIHWTLSVKEAKDLFNINFHVYTHPDNMNIAIIRSEERPQRNIFPLHVENVLDVVLGLNDFVPLKPSKVNMYTLTNKLSTLPIQSRQVNQIKSIVKYYKREKVVRIMPPMAPAILEVFFSRNQMFMAMMQYCGSPNFDPSNTSVPCVGYNYDISVVNYTITLQSAAGINSTATVFPPETIEYMDNNVYKIEVPIILKEYEKYGCSIVAGLSDGTFSETSRCGTGFNVTTVPPKDRLALTSPFFNPNLLRTYYGLPQSVPFVDSNSQSVAEFGDQYYGPKDMEKFVNSFQPDINIADKVIIEHYNNDSLSGDEAMLDIEWILATSPNVTTTFWHVNKSAVSPQEFGFILEWAIQMNAAKSPPLVTSISYGLYEVLLGEIFGDNYITRTNTEFIKLCTRGASVLASSGDAGATAIGHGGDTCLIRPQFPAGSPWVTAVSASLVDSIAKPKSNGQPGEVAVTIPNGMIWTTGSGFSNHTDQQMPKYQLDAVSKYLNNPSSYFPPKNLFNASGRCYPDISAIGHNLLTVVNQEIMPADGTSASSPIFASIISLLNSYRLASGKSPLGFLNPMLYQAPSSVWYDIVIGETSCGAYTCCPGLGFSAAANYDAVSGLGSLNDFQALKNYVMNLQ